MRAVGKRLRPACVDALVDRWRDLAQTSAPLTLVRPRDSGPHRGQESQRAGDGSENEEAAALTARTGVSQRVWRRSGRREIASLHSYSSAFAHGRVKILRRTVIAPVIAKPEDAVPEVLFYHLEHQPLERVLPMLLERTMERGWRAVVQVGSAERLEALDTRFGPIVMTVFFRTAAAATATPPSIRSI